MKCLPNFGQISQLINVLQLPIHQLTELQIESGLCSMGVSVQGNIDGIDAKSNTLTSRFVYDWRLKERTMADGTTSKCWLPPTTCGS